MVRVSRRNGFSGSALVRLLAHLGEPPTGGSPGPVARDARPDGFADRLSEWLGWADAIALSSALARPPADAAAATSPASATPAGPVPHEDECARVHAALTRAIMEEGLPPLARVPLPPLPGQREAPVDDPADFQPYRRRYLARQQAMEIALGALREGLRDTLAARSPELGRLAAVDAVMERVLGAQEHNLLAGVPALLDRHFQRLRQAADPAPEAAHVAAGEPAVLPDWLAAYRQDQQAVMLAELDLRFQPIEGLLDALRAAPATASPATASLIR